MIVPRKRAVENTIPGSSPASNRGLRPNRTPKKSQYFEGDSGQSDSSGDESEGSGYEDESQDAASALSSAEDIASDFGEALEPPRKQQKTRGRPSIQVAKPKTESKELWRSGVRTGLGPGTQVIIDKPRARSPGNVQYKDDQIHPNTMLFLRDLASNNDREWLKMHDPDYRASWQDFTDFLECLSPKVSEVDETVPELPIKDCLFRIYRDIRFSPDPTPYKPFFSVAWSRTGRKGPYACYYFMIKPGGGSLLGGGLWMPDAQALARLRQDIDRRPHRIQKVLTNAGIRASFLGNIPADDRRATKAFAKQNAETALKTKPRDYDANHENIELLRLKNFTMGRKLEDNEVVGPGALLRIVELITDLEPFITYLNSVVMPDDDEDSEGDDDDSSTSSRDITES